MTRHASVLVDVLGLALALGCGGDDASSTDTTEPTVAGDPVSCLEGAGLTDVEERASDLWRGNHSSPFNLVTVERLSSARDARQLAAEAVDIYVVTSGRYVIVGPAKPSAGGLVTVSEAAEATRLLREVGRCLS